MKKSIKFNPSTEKGRPGSAWWGLISELIENVSIPMVEAKFCVKSKEEGESIFDLVIRTGLAPNFQEAVALLANAFPIAPPAPRSLWEKILRKLASLLQRKEM